MYFNRSINTYDPVSPVKIQSHCPDTFQGLKNRFYSSIMGNSAFKGSTQLSGGFPAIDLPSLNYFWLIASNESAVYMNLGAYSALLAVPIIEKAYSGMLWMSSMYVNS